MNTKLFLSIFAVFLLAISWNVNAQDAVASGKKIFQDNCTVCHKIGEKLIGPNLEGVTTRRSEDWIKSFVKNSQKMVEAGDADAVKIYTEFNKTAMTAFEGNLSEDDLKNLVEYLKVAKAEVAPPPPVTTATTSATPAVAAAPALPANMVIGLSLVGLLIGIIAILILVIAFQLVAMLRQVNPEKANESWVVRLFAAFTGENDEFWNGKYTSEYAGPAHDGIYELDNNMPPWVAYLFYGGIAFGFIYILNYHVLGFSDLPKGEYDKEVAQATMLYGNNADKVKITLTELKEAPALEAGKAIYMKNCVACHGAEGQGGVGPNLTDDYWLHGAKIEEVFGTIRKGVPAKGMIAWKGQLTDEQILQTASFIKSLKGTNPANAKEAQGTKVE